MTSSFLPASSHATAASSSPNLSAPPVAPAIMVKLDDRSIGTDRIITATGSKDVLPDTPGVAAQWGEDVVHHAFCRAYEMRGQHFGVQDTGPYTHLATMLRLLNSHLTMVVHTPPTAAECKNLVERGITVLLRTVVQVLSDEARSTACVSLHDENQLELDGLVVATVVPTRAGPSAPWPIRHRPHHQRSGDLHGSTPTRSAPPASPAYGSREIPEHPWLKSLPQQPAGTQQLPQPSATSSEITQPAR
jgi:hypothetical protein